MGERRRRPRGGSSIGLGSGARDRWVTRASAKKLEDHHADYVQLLNQAPSVSQRRLLDQNGREQLRLSRLAISVGSRADLSRDARFTDTMSGGVSYAAPFCRISAPLMSIAVLAFRLRPHRGRQHRRDRSRLPADFLGDAQVGKVAFAYVVDNRGRVLASSARGPEVALNLATAAGRLADKTRQQGAGLGHGCRRPRGADGGQCRAKTRLARAVRAADRAGALADPRPVGAGRSLISLGLAIAILAGTLLARRMLVPITALSTGARRLGAGDFSQRIDVHTGRTDELEELADQFNNMAGQLQETYTGLETKVEERTRDLAQSVNELKVLEEVGRAVASSLDLNAVLPTVAARALEITHADAVLIFTYDAAKHQFNLTEAIGIDKSAQQARLAIDPDGSALGEASSTGEPVAIPDLADAPDHPLRDVAIAAGFMRCWWCRWWTSRAFWDRWWCCEKHQANFRRT